MQILFFVIPLLLLWMVVLRPQQRRMKEQQAVTQRADFGDEIVTAGGFVGTIVAVSDPDDDDNELEPSEVIVALADGIEVTMLRQGISQVRSKWDGEYNDGSTDADYDDGLTDADYDDGSTDDDYDDDIGHSQEDDLSEHEFSEHSTDSLPEAPESPADGD